MENYPPSRDLGGQLAAIEGYRRQLIDSGADPTPRLIEWGMKAIELSGVNLPKVPPGQSEWRWIRQFLSDDALDALVRHLEALVQANYKM